MSYEKHQKKYGKMLDGLAKNTYFRGISYSVKQLKQKQNGKFTNKSKIRSLKD